MTLSEIRNRLAVDGYVVDLATARQILRASQRGMFCWTKRGLTTVDESRLDLRRPFTVPRGHALYMRTQLRAAGYTRAELTRLEPVAEDQNRIDWSWYPLFCMREKDVVARQQRSRRRPRADQRVTL